MNIQPNQTIGEVARDYPEAIAIFEKFGLDFCCGGSESLQFACESKNLRLEEIVSAVEARRTEKAERQQERNWGREPLVDLIDHIVSRHHSYVRSELTRLERNLSKMCDVHGSKRPEFLRVQSLLQDLRAELEAHMMKEERVLFPYMRELEEALQSGRVPQSSCFGSVANPISMMEFEHDAANALLTGMQKELTDRSGCPTCQEFFRTLDAFEQDLHIHIHLENNILFPRAIELEQGA